MATEFKLPELGENIASGDIVNVLVNEGDTITANDGVIELETDKAVIEIPCPYGGRIAKLMVKKGDTVKVGQTILLVDAEDDSPAAEADVAKEAAAAPATSTSAASAPAAKAGPAEAPPAPSPAAAMRPRKSATADEAAAPIPAGPAARRIAREMGVDLHALSGSGTRGRITPEDVRSAAGAAPAAARRGDVAVEPYAPVTPPGEPDRDAWGPIRRDRIAKIRQTIAAQMAKSASTIPHVTNFDDADVTELEALRKSVPPGFLGEGLKLTSMPFVIRAVALALRRHPAINAMLDEANQQVVYKEYVNVGIAVDTPRGLIVPALREADRLSIPRIAGELAAISARAREGQFAIEDLRGGTFTISNLGAVGGIYSTPIINHPEVAILLVGRSRLMPVVREGQIVPRLMMPLSLSYDHRLVDGATASRFLNEVIDWLQSPGKLLLV